jgi:hypothetical protein
MTDPHDTHADSPGYVHDLRAALARPELRDLDRPEPPGDDARAAAYELALALGRCRLCGTEVGVNLPSTLSTPWPVAAAEVLEKYLGEWAEDARTLAERWERADDMVEAEDLCLGLLRARMEAWAVWVAVDDVYQDGLERGNADPRLASALDRLMDALERLDEGLREEIDLLSLAAGTNLLDNWRAQLAPRYRDNPPWWLDGTLEGAARRLDERALATQPGEAVGRKLRQALEAGMAAVAAAWLPRLRSAAAAGNQEPEFLPPRRWRSPDGTVLARLDMPRECDEGDEVVVTFSHPGAAVPPAGTPVWLANVPSAIDAAGGARFGVRALYAAGQPPILEVGAERAVLLPQDD